VHEEEQDKVSEEEQEESRASINVRISEAMEGGVWANFAAVAHSPYEFTIDFCRVNFGQGRTDGIVVARVNLSPLFVRQLTDALEQNWAKYAKKAMPREVHHDDNDNHQE
jgi:hypothetical protein